jgi:glycosyltransferase involved in cell wall biosynthesis
MNLYTDKFLYYLNLFKKQFFWGLMTKKICFFFGHYGPSLHVIIDYFEKIFPEDIELFVICAHKMDKSEEKYHFKRAKTFEFLSNKAIVPFQLRNFLKKNNIDILVTFGGEGKIALTLFIATVFTKIKTIFYLLINPKITLENCFFLFSQFFTTRFLSCGKEVSDKLKKFLFFKKEETFYLPFPVNMQLFKPKNKDKLRGKFGFNDQDKVFIYVGRIEFEQGSDYLLELIQTNQDKKFILIGEMRDEKFKEKKFKNVMHIPYVSNNKLPDYYNMADLSLFFSKRNSYPYPPRESLACGVPVILFDLNTFGQLITTAVKKLPFDIKKIQQEIDKFFLLSKKERKELSEEGRKFIIEDSSEEKIKDITLNYLLDL